MEIAYSWLQGLDVDSEELKKLKISGKPPTDEELVRGISWLMSLGGPTLIAIDQIDSIVAASNLIADKVSDVDDETESAARSIIHLFGDGLLKLQDITRRSMTVLACLGETWTVLEGKVLKAVKDRFKQPVFLTMASSENGQITNLIGSRLRTSYSELNVIPPYPTWPFSVQAIAKIGDVYPRKALMLCENFRLKCSSEGKVAECLDFVEVITAPPDKGKKPPSSFDVKFEQQKMAVDVGTAKLGDDDGKAYGELITTTLELYAAEIQLPDDVDVLVSDYSGERRPTLHSRLTFTFHSKGDLERHYCFRAIEQSNARSVQTRLRAAMTASGIDKKLPFRHLFILREAEFPAGKVSGELAARFFSDGGKCVAPTENDLRTFIALREMQAAKLDGFGKWLQSSRPLSSTAFFQLIGLSSPPLSSSSSVNTQANEKPSGQSNAPFISGSKSLEDGDSKMPLTTSSKNVTLTEVKGPKHASSPLPIKDPTISLGHRIEGGVEGRQEFLRAALLTRHIAIFAGSGSGKTVLLRRIVEEAALLGYPEIVLDTNNDLARLGKAWPSRPTSFSDDDAERASRYHKNVEVRIWTPGLTDGRPLNLAILPDFGSITDNQEREQAVDMAWATLVPLMRATGGTKDLKEGLLKDALRSFSQQSKGGIEGFISFLADLPEGVSKQTKAQKLAADMSDQLIAKIAVNPLLSAPGQKLNPAALFTAEKSGKTPISVINFAGLQADASRQDFANQLQMALFTFIRKNPSETPRLYVIDEAQNFAPSVGMTASKASAKALAAQARKFGLGMIFATQAPKGIDTNIVSNCTTHFYGRMSSPELTDSTKEMMASRGKAAQDLGALTTGTFYYSTEHMTQPAKLKTPLCLSYHPQNPATVEEILELSRNE